MPLTKDAFRDKQTYSINDGRTGHAAEGQGRPDMQQKGRDDQTCGVWVEMTGQGTQGQR